MSIFDRAYAEMDLQRPVSFTPCPNKGWGVLPGLLGHSRDSPAAGFPVLVGCRRGCNSSGRFAPKTAQNRQNGYSALTNYGNAVSIDCW